MCRVASRCLECGEAGRECGVEDRLLWEGEEGVVGVEEHAGEGLVAGWGPESLGHGQQ